MDPTTLRHVMISAGVFLAVTTVALFARGLLFTALRRWTAQTATSIDDVLLSVIRGPSIFWTIALGLYIGIGTSVLPARMIQIAFSTLHALVILSFTFVAANVASYALRYAAHRAELPLTGLAQGVAKSVVIALGVLI